MIKKAIIPMGGLGTRFLPATKIVPKELFPILNKPVIQYLVEELIDAGVNDIVFVISKEKESIREHFSPNQKLESILEERGKDDILGGIKKIANLANFSYVEQSEPLGDGHAILCAKDEIGNEPCVVIFGDTFVDAEISMTKQMIEVYEQHESSVISVMKIPKKDTKSYGIVAPKKEGKVFEIADLIEKPEPEKSPSNLAIIGSYIITASIFEELEKNPSGVDGEIRLIDGFNLLKEKEKIFGCEIQGEWLDTGTVFGWLKANIHMALKDEKLGEEMREYLKLQN